MGYKFLLLYSLCGLIVAVDNEKKVIMLRKSEKLIAVGVVVLFIFIVFSAITDRDTGADNKGPNTTTQIHYSSPSQGFGVGYSKGGTYLQHDSSYNREQILKSKVKGYRESIYWGAEHALDEQVRHMNDDEFEHYINEEVIPEDNDVYWGAEY